jgi:hypothetical protein
LVTMYDWTFVGADGVGTALQSRPDVVNCRPPGRCVQGAGFKQRIGLAQPQPIANPGDTVGLGEISRKNLLSRESLWRCLPAQSARTDTGHAVTNSVASAKF